MLPRLVRCNRAIALIPKTQSLCSRGSVQAVRYASGHKSQLEIHKEALATTNNLTVPSGSWQEYYNKKNAKYNMQVLVNLVVLIATGIVMDRVGIFDSLRHPNYKTVEIDWSKPMDVLAADDE